MQELIDSRQSILYASEDPREWIKKNIVDNQKDKNIDVRQKFYKKLEQLKQGSLVVNNSGLRPSTGNYEDSLEKMNIIKNLDRSNSDQDKSVIDDGKNDQQNKFKLAQNSENIDPIKLSQQNQAIFDKQLIPENSYQNGDFQLNIFSRTDKEIRNNYIQKLQQNKIMNKYNEPSKKQQTVTIFDWDDTLLCTSYLGVLGFIDLQPEVTEQLNILDQSAVKLLLKATQYGTTYIITNAAQGWVEYSSKLYFKNVYSLLSEKDKIVVISARNNYEELYPGDCHRWKHETFKDITKYLEKNIVTNLICLGDSHIEMEAAQHMASMFQRNVVFVKTIKFRENPKPDELVKQQELVSEKFEQIYMNVRNLTIRLEKKPQQESE